MKSRSAQGRNPLFIGSSLRTTQSGRLRYFRKRPQPGRNPLFIGSSLRTPPRARKRSAWALRVVIPFSSGQVFGHKGALFASIIGCKVVIPFSSGQVFGRCRSSTSWCRPPGGRNPLFIGSSLRTGDRQKAPQCAGVVIPFSSGQVFGPDSFRSVASAMIASS